MGQWYCTSFIGPNLIQALLTGADSLHNIMPKSRNSTGVKASSSQPQLARLDYQVKTQPSGPHSVCCTPMSQTQEWPQNLFMLPLSFTVAERKSPVNISTDHSQALSSTIRIPLNPQAAKRPLKGLCLKATDSQSIQSRCTWGLLAT